MCHETVGTERGLRDFRVVQELDYELVRAVKDTRALIVTRIHERLYFMIWCWPI